jgi:serine/threonine-protein kinase
VRSYATVDAFADDVDRYLRGEVVQARPDRFGYRLGKTLMRHRIRIAAVSAVLLAVLGGAAGSLVQAQRANAEAERARVVKDFVVEVFKVNGQSDPANNGLRQLLVEMLLERGASLIDAKFPGQT